MTLKNTEEHYGSIAKWLHWLTALLFLGAYVSVYYRQWFTEAKTPENWNALQIHLSVGITIFVVVMLRIVWRCVNLTPKPEPGSRVEHAAARAGHFFLYFIMVAMPLTGYLGTSVDTEFFLLFDIPKFESTVWFSEFVAGSMGITFESFEKPIDFIHKDILGAWLAWILILGHVAAALYHTFVKGDKTMQKMTFAAKTTKR